MPPKKQKRQRRKVPFEKLSDGQKAARKNFLIFAKAALLWRLDHKVNGKCPKIPPKNQIPAEYFDRAREELLRKNKI